MLGREGSSRVRAPSSEHDKFAVRIPIAPSKANSHRGDDGPTTIRSSFATMTRIGRSTGPRVATGRSGRPGGAQGTRDDQGRDNLPALFSPQVLDGSQAHHGTSRIMRPLIDFQHIFHVGYEAGVGLGRNDPLLLEVRLKCVFLASG
jgi:hypothetical protein